MYNFIDILVKNVDILEEKCRHFKKFDIILILLYNIYQIPHKFHISILLILKMQGLCTTKLLYTQNL